MKENFKYVPLKNDKAFKVFFSKKENRKFLVKLIEQYLPIKINEEDEIEYRNTEAMPKSPTGKIPRMDILLRIKKPQGEFINIEMQVQNRYNLIKRTSYYNAMAYAEQLGAGENYKKLGNVMSLIFSCHDVFSESEKYVNNIAYVHEETGKTIEEDRRMCFVELYKYRDNKEKYEKDTWAELLIAESDEDFEKLERSGGIMAEAVKKIYGFSQEYKDRYWEDMYKKAEHDYISDMEGAKEEGISIGETRGIKIGETRGIKIGEARGKLLGISENKLHIAKNMFKLGLDKETVKKATQLSEEEIKGLMN